jgi:membrane-associated phospholipid phosphatase
LWSVIRRPLIGAAACALVAALFYVAVVKTPALQRADVRVLEGFMGLWGLPGTSFADDFIRLFNPGPFAVLSGSLIVATLVAKRYRQAALAFTVMLGAGVTTQILKPLLAVQREYPAWHFMGPEAYPSGHTTAVMSLALALVIVAPSRWRPLAAAGGGLLTIATVFSILVHGGHYPSDIIGGFLVATGWAYLASAALRVEARPSVAGPALGAAVLAALALLLVLWRPADALNYAVANTTFVLGALVIAAGALALSGSVPVPRGAPRRPPRHSPHARG